ncbi:hypothetical protein D9O50_04630 [Oxalobacteraceae bacterium CAVE-383]|nr:hypothetical protein D9O50_04630 [Oxalobacteraceae bacterium CAVE-383]
MTLISNTQVNPQLFPGFPPAQPSRPGASINLDAGDVVTRQESLNEMINDLMGKITPLDRKILDFEKEMRAHADITADLRAAQAAFETYLTEHPDQQGNIDTAGIIVNLPEKSPLGAAISLYALMEHYRTAQPELQLPAMPQIIAKTAPYQNALDRAITMTSSFLAEDKNSALTALISRRQGLFDLMGQIIKSYSELMHSMLRR